MNFYSLFLMTIKDFTGILPEQYTGKEITAEASQTCKDNQEAIAFYEIAKNRLLDVNNWHHLAGVMSARFQVVSPDGKEVNRKAEKGDYFKIDIPGPGSKEGDGYDWVKLEEVKEVNNPDVQSIGLRVRPASNPLGSKNETAHFYDESTTGNFIVVLEKNKITAAVVDRNTKPNDDASSLTDKLRHSTVGTAAIASFSKIQWQKLVDGIIKKK